MDRPLSESYWVVEGRLLAGEYPGKFEPEQTRQRIDALIEAGFDTFVDLTKEDETWPYLPILHEESAVYEVKFSHLRFPIGDFGLPTSDQMNAILDSLEKGLESGRKIYLHCWGGIGRTGTTVGCYLVRKGKSGEEALNQVAAWWQHVPKSHYHTYSPETLEQVKFIQAWAENDHKLITR